MTTDLNGIEDLRSVIAEVLDELEETRQRVFLIRLAVTSDLLGSYGSEPIAQGLDDLHVDMDRHIALLRSARTVARQIAQMS
ncbi:hypothetical protein DLJ53_20725 [Acuticoccus sediminis]|uniref:Uncharacterized protein n=1 Tax=Acuticoccus sediminis TaxID=2184697 RepID=A0A8B2NWR3_9HYPH|nr:hypothetical protein [Acuticoccus sediminis]RAI00137.1 hypothetical protein DLJ53_20725 [Acuticoccus sediminis]